MIALAAAVPGCAERPRPRNAVLVVLDTLRADRVSAYGHARPTTPVIDALAGNGVLFEKTVTNSTWTLPAVSGLMSGRFLTRSVLDHGLQVSLVARLHDAGLRTAAFTDGGFVSQHFGFGIGFDVFQEQEFKSPFMEPKGRAPRIAEGEEIAHTFGLAREWLERNGAEPFFLFVHTYEPHTPYLRTTFAEDLDSGVFRGTFGIVLAAMAKTGRLTLGDTELTYLRALYDGDVLESDRHLGMLLETLREIGRAEDTLVVVTSDHGEDLGDRDPPWPGSHGHAVYDEQALVPLVISDPTRGYPVRRVTAQVRTLDVMPTVLELLGLPRDEGADGRSLVPLMEGAETQDRLAWTRVNEHDQYDHPNLYALRTGRFKLVYTPGGEGAEDSLSLFDLESDAGETHDVSDEHPEERDRLLSELGRLRERVEGEGVPNFEGRADSPDSVQDRLRQLGYVE